MGGVRGVGAVCEMCMCLARGVVESVGVRRLGSGVSNPVGTWGVWDVCLGGGGIGRKWVGGLGQGGWCLCGL